jgi:hypothetical protein
MRKIHEIAAKDTDRVFTNIKIREVKGWSLENLKVS